MFPWHLALAVFFVTGHAQPISSSSSARSAFIGMEAMRGETMTGIARTAMKGAADSLLSSFDLTNMEQSLRNKIEEMRRNASHLIHQRAAQIEEHLRETKLRHLQAREVLANSLGALANLVTLRWARLSVTSFHGRLGKCCCEGTGCEWQSFDFGGAQMDYECKLGFSDYLDVLNFNPGAEGAALSKSTAVDDILDQCSKKVGQSSGSSASTDETQDLGLLRILPAQGWPYPSMEWSPPSQPSLPAEAQTAPVEALLKLAPSEPMVVEVSEVVKPQGHTTSTEPEGETPAVDLDLETVTDSVKDSPDAGLTPQTGVEFPHAENRKTVKRVEDPIRSEEEPAEAPASPQAGEEAESDSLHALNQAAQQLAEAEQAVSKPLAPPGEALPEAAAPAAGPEQDIPFPRTEALTRTPQIEQEPEAQEISRLQKKQSFKANAGAAANAAENALKNEVQKVLLNLARKRDPALFQQSIKRLDALEIG
mmetsp:Transcript_24211/g.52702  ORF Transcript_24211/g.52702 Transcript_24211/m.52702 type:complete len:480 (-) Transcript_24211:18-1457(-)